jgi:aminopeptidase
MIGKGITFDSGGLCLKNDSELAYMRGDMAGAACVVATMKAISSLRLPINVRALLPLCENMPGASATKPGDIVRSINGKSILVSDTDYEGVLVLSDALAYAQKYKPKFILDVGTLTKEMFEMMGTSATGVFTNCDNLWKSMKMASIHTGDRVWRFPLWKIYNRLLVPKNRSSDLTNSPRAHIGLSCTSAALLHAFTCDYDWIHLDSYGVMRGNGSSTYLSPGMSGRPTRTMIEFLAQFSCQSCPPCE